MTGLLLIAALLAADPAVPQPAPPLDAVFAEAKAHHQAVLLDIYTAW